MPNIGDMVAAGTPAILAYPGAQRSVRAVFSFAIGATGAPGASSGLAGGGTLVRNGAGDYTLTLPGVKSIQVEASRVTGANPTAAGDRRQVYVGAIDSGAGTVNLLTVAADGSGTGSDPTDGSSLHFAATLVY